MEDKRAPLNTERQVREEPLFGLITAMEPNGSGIEAQEAQGQRSFVQSDTLPTSYMGGESVDNNKKILETAGVKFLGIVENDDKFQYVELPIGWEKVATDHSMWSRLLDDKGRERALIFYKAAFYDRSSYISLSTRYQVKRDYDRQKSENVIVTLVLDGETVVYTTEPIQLPDDEGKVYEVGQESEKVVFQWLDANHPDWRDPGAYWD